MITASKPATMITYELPLNEHMRICLRLEHLFRTIKQHANQPSIDDSRTTIRALAQLMEVVDRPDLKSKLGQMLSQLATTFGQLKRLPQVDDTQLQSILDELDKHIHYLHHYRHRIGNELFRNEFLKNLRLQLNNPGGAIGGKATAYKLWLQLPPEKRIKHCMHWAETLNDLEGIIDIILRLVRESTPPETISALDGFYHQPLNPALPCELIRISIPSDANVYPETSVGRHRLMIRFMRPDFLDDGRAAQASHTIRFQLSCCRI